MASPENHAEHPERTTLAWRPRWPATEDPVESIVPLIPVVLPVVGGLLMFLLAWIAIYMA